MTANEMSAPAVPVHTPDPVPAGVLDAFWRYDAALLANDRAILDELRRRDPGPPTVPGPAPLRTAGPAEIDGPRTDPPR